MMVNRLVNSVVSTARMLRLIKVEGSILKCLEGSEYVECTDTVLEHVIHEAIIVMENMTGDEVRETLELINEVKKKILKLSNC